MFNFRIFGIILGLAVLWGWQASSVRAAEKPRTRDTLVMDMRRAKAKSTVPEGEGLRVPSAKIAAILSAVVPGAGQIYNRAYWKVPIVWGAMAGMGYLVVNNYLWYRKAGFAYLAKQKADQGDASLLPQIDPLMVPLSTVTVRSYRNKFREDVDLYGLLLLVLWGLNVMEAAVHAHLQGFDISPKLSLRAYPQLLSTPWDKAYGLGFSLSWNKAKPECGKSIFRELSPLL